MNKIDSLISNYEAHITVPWRDVAPAQRVIFCVYDEDLERNLRAKLGEFELVTVQANHRWLEFDMTSIFANWLSKQRYAKEYFEQPDQLSSLLPRFIDYIEEQVNSFISEEKADHNTVVAFKGVGSLFGFIKVNNVVERIAPVVKGRLLVFFPGSYDENNNYRLLDGYDGWNYLAVPITPNKDF